MKRIRVGILTVSDSCADGKRKDAGGPAIAKWARKMGWVVERRSVVSDKLITIAYYLCDWSDEHRLDLILTTGGTGVGPRDVTPEATQAILEKKIPGICETLRKEGSKHTPFAVLSRAAAGARGKTLIINLPGNPKSFNESFLILEAIIPHSLRMIAGAGHNHEKKDGIRRKEDCKQ